MKVSKLVYRADNFGMDAPHIAVQVSGGSYGVWVALFDRNGRATGAARPVASGCRLTEAEAVNGAKAANHGVGGPSATGSFQMGGVTG